MFPNVVARDVSQEVSALFEYVRNLPRGTVIPHHVIEQVTTISRRIDGIRDNPVYSKVIRKWRDRMLVELGIYPDSSKGVGYKLPTVTEQIDKIPNALESGAARKVVKAKKIVGSIKERELSDFEKRFKRERVRQDDEKLAMDREHKGQRRSFLANPDTLPRYNGSGRD